MDIGLIRMGIAAQAVDKLLVYASGAARICVQKAHASLWAHSGCMDTGTHPNLTGVQGWVSSSDWRHSMFGGIHLCLHACHIRRNSYDDTATAS